MLYSAITFLTLIGKVKSYSNVCQCYARQGDLIREVVLFVVVKLQPLNLSGYSRVWKKSNVVVFKEITFML